ncbi:hypothetical protein N7G274_007381 [Stereocaulon virgatum]|uniref:Myb-like DNA-binding domain-containing protein n=1 Tax=Stereocaulon virgatum TaxID=373712 RepID=A0ABR4A4I2_9LECA
MPKSFQPDENLMFLYNCLKNSDYTKIDFQAVGAHMNLKDSAARMRFTRLRKAIEDSQDGQHATAPATVPTTTPVATPSKRKKDLAKADDGGAKKVKVEPNADWVKSGEQDEGG